jgi:hypothetical protein
MLSLRKAAASDTELWRLGSARIDATWNRLRREAKMKRNTERPYTRERSASVAEEWNARPVYVPRQI